MQSENLPQVSHDVSVEMNPQSSTETKEKSKKKKKKNRGRKKRENMCSSGTDMVSCNRSETEAETKWSWYPLESKQERKELKSVYFRVRKSKIIPDLLKLRSDYLCYDPTEDDSFPGIYQWYVTDFNGSSWSSYSAKVVECGGLYPATTTMPPNVPDYSTAFAMDSRIYVAGGLSPTHIRERGGIRRVFHDKFFMYDTAFPENGWKEGPSMIVKRQSPAAVAVDGKIYVFGGNYYNHKDQYLYAEVFDPLLDKWELLPQPPTKMSPFVSPVHALLLDSRGNKHLLLHPSGNRALFTYNLDDKSWTLFDASFGCQNNLAAAVDGVLYCYNRLGVVGYDLVERRWFSKPVRGLDSDRTPTTDIPGYLLHIGGGKLCLVWSHMMSHICQVEIYCTVFTVKRYHADGEDSILLADIEFTTHYYAGGHNLIDCVAL